MNIEFSGQELTMTGALEQFLISNLVGDHCESKKHEGHIKVDLRVEGTRCRVSIHVVVGNDVYEFSSNMTDVRSGQVSSAEKPRLETVGSVDTTVSGGEDSDVVIDSRGGFSVDLDHLLTTEHGRQSIEKLRRVPVEVSSDVSVQEKN